MHSPVTTIGKKDEGGVTRAPTHLIICLHRSCMCKCGVAISSASQAIFKAVNVSNSLLPSSSVSIKPLSHFFSVSHILYLQCNMAIGVFGLSTAFAAVLVIFYLLKAIYNFYFHPLAHIPGPWWAAVSYLPEIYYDVIKGGRYFTVVIEMHKRYGTFMKI
jgi:hypothetical protein